MVIAIDNPTVFVSYSHKDEEWKDKLLPHLKMLEQQDRLVVWDDRRIDAGASWYPEIREAMERAAVAVCLISANFLSSDFCIKEEVPFLLNRREKQGMVLIPVLVDTCAFELIDWLAPLQMLPSDGKSVAVDYAGRDSVIFTDVARRVNRSLQEPGYRTEKAVSRWAPLGEQFIDIDRLPQTGYELFGRQKELELLDEAWESNKCNLISLIDFNSQSLADFLPDAGYDDTRCTFFIWEGVSFYLTAQSVDSMLGFIRARSPKGSSIIFDYVLESFVNGDFANERARKSFEYHRSIGEPYVLGIPENTIHQFLGERGFEVISDLGPRELERAYLTHSDGSLHGHVFDYIRIVHARVEN